MPIAHSRPCAAAKQWAAVVEVSGNVMRYGSHRPEFVSSLVVTRAEAGRSEPATSRKRQTRKLPGSTMLRFSLPIGNPQDQLSGQKAL
jgi:hypothetical protein